VESSLTNHLQSTIKIEIAKPTKLKSRFQLHNYTQHQPKAIMSAYEQITSLMGQLNNDQKLTLIEDLATSIRQEGGIPAAAKGKGKGKAKAKDSEEKPKRKAALGNLAWAAYRKHIKETRPEAFTPGLKDTTVSKLIRAEDPEAYTAWIEAWKEEHKNDAADSASVASDLGSQADVETASVTESVAPAAVAAKPVAKPVAIAAKPVAVAAKPAATKAEKEAAKAEKEAAKATKDAEKAAAKAEKDAAKAEKEAAKATKDAEKAAAKEAKATKPKAEKAEKAEKKPVKVAKAAEQPTMGQKEIDGVFYWFDPETNGLWDVIGETVADGTGAWKGYFQPGNDDEPIRETGNFGDE
jgi:hypothetical protein